MTRGDEASERGERAVAGGEEEETVGKGLEIGKLLPLNKPNLRVKIPGFDKGKLATEPEE